jgi:hypothetical protein
MSIPGYDELFTFFQSRFCMIAFVTVISSIAMVRLMCSIIGYDLRSIR